MDKSFTVLIAGRENVGKSSIFNKFIGKNKAIVDDFPGVTRDKLYGEAEWTGKKFRVVDTGGLLFEGKNKIKSLVEKQVDEVIKEAGLTLFVTDVKAGIQPGDRAIFKKIKRNAKNYAVVANKADNFREAYDTYDFYNLGADKVFPVSAAHSLGLDDLLDYIVSFIPEIAKEEEEAHPAKISIMGRENAGKSSVFNAIVKQERSIVTEIPGTTRDSVDAIVEYAGKKVIVIDTAGVKKRKRIKEKADKYGIGRAFANIKRSDIAVHIIDAVEGIKEMDKKVLGYAYDHYKGLVIAVNKWDLIDKKERKALEKKYVDYIRANFKFASFVPVVFISAKKNEGIKKILDVVFYVENQYNLRVKTSLLNRVFREAIYNRPPAGKKGVLRVYYMSQVGVNPPSFVLFVNKKEKLRFNYMRYIENELRRNFGFEGTPLKFMIREKERK